MRRTTVELFNRGERDPRRAVMMAKYYRQRCQAEWERKKIERDRKSYRLAFQMDEELSRYRWGAWQGKKDVKEQTIEFSIGLPDEKGDD